MSASVLQIPIIIQQAMSVFSATQIVQPVLQPLRTVKPALA